MKNISAYEMNFEAEEMMERFVRGDESRTSEGHGLGLAIASSYTANMGGRMELAADGDLFKVILRFPEAGEDSAAGETATKNLTCIRMRQKRDCSRKDLQKDSERVCNPREEKNGDNQYYHTMLQRRGSNSGLLRDDGTSDG